MVTCRLPFGYYRFRLVEQLSLIIVFIRSHNKLIVVFGFWLGSYHKYGTYQAISHTNIEIPMELSELTGLRSKQICGNILYWLMTDMIE
jgi:hypothetical protein